MPVCLAVIALLININGLKNGFVWDDREVITNNAGIKNFDNVSTLLTSADRLFLDEKLPYYRPLVRLSYVIDYQLFGLDPFGYHCENVLIHSINVLLVYYVGLHLLLSPSAAFIAALLFALHPVNAETVNFISAKNNLLASLCMLSSLLFYIKSRAQTASPMLYAGLSTALFFLGLLSKEIALMLIPMLVGYNAIYGKHIRKNWLSGQVYPLIPYAVAASIYLFFRSLSLQGLIGIDFDVSGSVRGALQNLYIIPRYVMLLIAPLRLNAHYLVPGKYWLMPWVWIVWAGIAVLCVFLWQRRNPLLYFSAIWLAGNFLPISHVVPFSSAALADRYLYMPMIGVCFISADHFSQWYAASSRRKSLVAMGLALAVVFAGISIARNRDWRDNIALYSSMVKADPDSTLAHYDLGNAYKDSGNLAQAFQEWNEVVSLAPGHFLALGQIGTYWLVQGRPQDAAVYYERALKANPDFSEAHYNLAITREQLHEPGPALKHYLLFLNNVPPEHRGLVPGVTRKVASLKNVMNREE